MRELVILRGNSSSGKTFVAKDLQQLFGLNTMLISQDVDISIDNIEFWKRKDGIFKDFVGFIGNIMQKSCTICDKLGKNYR